MADFSALKTAIQNYIKQNGNEEITGEILQTILLSIVTTLGDSAINDLITALNAEVADRQNADSSLEGAINQEGTLRSNADTALQAAINLINSYIPAQASSSNKLADKDFVNSSIATATATFRGTYNVVTDLELSYNATHAQIQAALVTKMSALSITPDNNDYAFVQIPTSDATPTQIAKTEKYKYNGSAWAFEYVLSNSGFTAAQWAAINSGATLELIGKLSALPTNAQLIALLDNKVSWTDNGAYDVTTHNSGATFASLSALLNSDNLATLIPTDIRKGGMSIKFVQSSDNKYVQYIYTGEDTTELLNTDYWQKVNNESKIERADLDLNKGVWEASDFINTPFAGVDNSYYSANGVAHYVATQHHIGKFYVKEGDKFAIYSYCNSNELMIAAYDIQGDIILSKSVAGESAVVSTIYTVPEGVYSIRIFSIKRSSFFEVPKVQFINNTFHKVADSQKHIVENAIRFNIMNGIDITGETMTNESVVNGWNFVSSNYVWLYNVKAYHTILPTKQGEKYNYYGQSVANCLIIVALDSNFNIITDACVAGDNTSISSGTYTVPENVSYIMFCSRKDVVIPYLFCLGKGMLIDDGMRTVLNYDVKGNITSIVETTIDGVTKTRTIQYNSKQQVSSIVTVSSDYINSSEAITYDTGNKISEINTIFTKAY